MKRSALLAVMMCVAGLPAIRYGWGVRSSDPYRGTWCVPFPKGSGHLYCDGIPTWQFFVGAGVGLVVMALVLLALVVLEQIGRPLDSAPAARNRGKDV
ncbi:hypothetical protein ACFWAY_17665 [Rhodococcus sp. NPDC059968]|uniref:hypothetical protein n=1 Tax=Rhodococcus sp. NPDC059968 TaxID=3347017 RepID=UPI0036731F4B